MLMSYLCPFVPFRSGAAAGVSVCPDQVSAGLEKTKTALHFRGFVNLFSIFFCQNVKLSGASVKELITAFAFFR